MLGIHLGSWEGKGHSESVEVEPGPRRTARTCLGLLQGIERVRNPEECLSRSSGLAKVVSYAKTSQTSIWELVWGCGDEWGRQERREVCFAQIRQYKKRLRQLSRP